MAVLFLQPGYRIGERVVRAAQVQVAEPGPAPETEPAPEPAPKAKPAATGREARAGQSRQDGGRRSAVEVDDDDDSGL